MARLVPALRQQRRRQRQQEQQQGGFESNVSAEGKQQQKDSEKMSRQRAMQGCCILSVVMATCNGPALLTFCACQPCLLHTYWGLHTVLKGGLVN